MTAPALSRLMDEQPGFAVDPPVSGRTTPRPAPLPDGFRHDVRFRASDRHTSYATSVGITAYCKPCDWTVFLDNGHDITDLIRLVAMHAGVADITLITTEAVLDLLRPLVKDGAS